MYFIFVFFLSFFGFLLMFTGFYFIIFDMQIFLDWEILSVNSCIISMSIILDWMSMIFMGSVMLISSMVIFYSYDYMSNDNNQVRFLFLVFLFILSMLFLIVSPNLISILLGWDGLGLVSYCLVIYYNSYNSFNSGMLTLLTNRIGDVCIIISIAWCLNFGGWHYLYYYNFNYDWSFYLFVLLVTASFTKSAQIPFSSWLPAAMAAPTPVSALVHSSTLVTAGVYLMIRFYNFFVDYNCMYIVMFGCLTMFMSGVGANFEFDLSKIIALSTLSQLGLMMGCLFMGYPVLCFFHLLAHAFFKSLLFLCAGLVIHNMSDCQDIRYMGFIFNSMPYTSTCFLISSLSLCGFPFLSGFYSKDLILEFLSFDNFNLFMFFIFFISIGLTISYSFRLIYYLNLGDMKFYVFHSYFEGGVSLLSMIMLVILSIIFGGLMMWIIFLTPMYMVIPMYINGLILVMIFFGFIFGLELYNYVVFRNLIYIYHYLGLMWFFPYFSTYNNHLYYKFSFNFNKSVDLGWGEYLISSSLVNLINFISLTLSYLIFNNLSIYMFSFILFFLLLFI
uniref:NADH-ubiquinone oxidoreductase chain 5 n=1 Tax=Cantacader sp. TaxID=2931283 RepID=A0A8T9ZXR3_9HEMI|nr:NADH dehydrogenase subunit 5 [Cantacader sp.]